jgi:hypothetical protein
MRSFVLVATFTFAAGRLFADAAPEPPPKGEKYVNVEVSVAIDKNVTGYVFAISVAEGQGGGRPHITYSPIKLGEKPVVLSAYEKSDAVPGPLDRRRKVVTNVFAIPAEAAKKYSTEKELTDAIAAGTVPGTHRMGVAVIDTISKDDKRTAIPWKYTITAVDPKTGIAVKKERDGKPFEGKEPQARERNGTRSLVAGCFATVAIVGLGFWLVGRRRPA